MLYWIKDSISDYISEFGYPAIALFMFLENLIPPIPSEFIMPLAGFLTTLEEFSLVLVVIAGTTGSVVGTLPLYYLGRYLGEDNLKDWTRKYGKWIMINEDDIEKAMSWFDNHG